jgi:IS5 family transposase
MKQADLGVNLSIKRTRKREFLDEVNRVVPWAELITLIEPHYLEGKTGRPPMGISTMLRVHFMQQWFGLSDAATEEALYDVPLYCEFAGLGGPMGRLPDESTNLWFRHMLKKHELAGPMLATVNQVLQAHGLMLKTGTVVDATLISAPSSTKNNSGTRDPEMRQTKKGNNWYFGMKAHLGADAESGLVHTVIGTPANTNDVTQAEALLHGGETVAFGDAGYQGVAKRPESSLGSWHVTMRPGKRRELDVGHPVDAIHNEIERLKASVRAKVEHPFRVVKRQFGFGKVRYLGLAKNTAQLKTLFALSNLWMARRKLMAVTA